MNVEEEEVGWRVSNADVLNADEGIGRALRRPAGDGAEGEVYDAVRLCGAG